MQKIKKQSKWQEKNKEENKEENKEKIKSKNKLGASAYVWSHTGLSELATVIGSANFTSKTKRLELLDLLGGLTPLDVEGEQTLLQGLVEEGTIILVCPIDSAAPKAVLSCHRYKRSEKFLITKA